MPTPVVLSPASIARWMGQRLAIWVIVMREYLGNRIWVYPALLWVVFAHKRPPPLHPPEGF